MMVGVGGQGHVCGLPGDHLAGLNCLSDEQILPILLYMDADSLLNSGRSSDRLHRLVCDRKVWFHLLKQTAEFSKEKLEELVDFVPEKRRPELMPEVLRAAASKLPSSDPRSSPIKIIWAVQGWGAPETLDMMGGNFGACSNNLKELQTVAKAVRINFTILEVLGFESSWGQHYPIFDSLKKIAVHVEQQGEKLANFEMSRIPLVLNETFLSLQRMSMKWKVKQVSVSLSSGTWMMELLNYLADSSLDNGHIGNLLVHLCQEHVNLIALKKVWEIADEMVIILSIGHGLLKFKGGRGEDPDAAWQLVTNFFLHVNGNNND